jgi:hypothetical protein
VETDPVSLTAYELGLGVTAYTEVGSWGLGEFARLDWPFRVEIDVAALVA